MLARDAIDSSSRGAHTTSNVRSGSPVTAKLRDIISAKHSAIPVRKVRTFIR